MLFRLVVEKNGKRARVVELRGPSACIGRARGNEVRIPSADVSRRHCILRVDDGLLRVEDLESVNGTYLNGDLITGEAVVRPGDRLEVGPIHFVVEYDLTPDALERLREMDYEVVQSGPEIAAADDDEEAPTKHKPKPRGRPAAEEEETEDVEPVEDEDILDVEAVVEEEYTPRADLDEVTWAPPQEGDLRDLLGRLDEGQESLLPKKRPGPRKPTQKREDDWPADRRAGLPPPDPKGKGGKRRPKADED